MPPSQRIYGGTCQLFVTYEKNHLTWEAQSFLQNLIFILFYVIMR